MPVITVSASYTDGQGQRECQQCADGRRANVNDAPTGSVTISGTPTEDQILTAAIHWPMPMAWARLSYQWYRDGVAIGGATGTTYTLGDADVGAPSRLRPATPTVRAPMRVSPVPASARSPTSTMPRWVYRPLRVPSAKIRCLPLTRPVSRMPTAWVLQLSVVARWCRHWRRDRQHLHPGRCRCRYPDQCAGQLHRLQGTAEGP